MNMGDPQQLTVFPSAARTATVNSAEFANYGWRGLHLVVDVTAIVTAPSVVFTVQGYSTLAANYYTLLTSAAITAVGTTVLRVYPTLTAAANVVANDNLPPLWRVIATHGNANSISYSVNALLLP